MGLVWCSQFSLCDTSHCRPVPSAMITAKSLFKGRSGSTSCNALQIFSVSGCGIAGTFSWPTHNPNETISAQIVQVQHSSPSAWHRVRRLVQFSPIFARHFQKVLGVEKRFQNRAGRGEPILVIFILEIVAG